MADEQIVTNIVATSDFSSLIADVQRTSVALSKLQSQLSLSNTALANQAGQIQKGFGETLRSTGQFTSHFVTVGSEVDKFGKSLDAGRLKLKDYFRTWQDHTRTSGGLIRGLAKEQVALQQSIVQSLGKSADGMQKFNVHVKTGLDEIANRTALAKKEMQIYNKVIQDGGNQIINWGKNTQWAGRQLTVGLTVPIAAFGVAASKAFRDADQELVRLTKVYGGLAATSTAELAKVRKDVSATAKELAAAYGVSYKDTISLAADIAATGKQGNELLQSTKEATRLSVLGEVDRQEAMKATLAIQSAFKQNTMQLTESINFLNAVENQTSTSLADLVEAIPKAGPVVKALGGDVEDLALYLTAMREGGINASEGANALKSALASIINPTKVAKEQFMGFGIDLGGIVTKNAGNLTGTILEIQAALETLDPLKKSQAIEQLFGKFQFARMNALFENLGKQGSQTLQVLDLMKASSQDLANVAGRELSQITESASGRYRRALESLKADLAKVGEEFLKIQTFFIELIDKVINFANKLPEPIQKVLTLLAGFTAAAGPLIMLTGVFANFFGYIIKGIGHLRALFKGGEGFKLLTPQIVAANNAASLIEKTFYSDAKAAATLASALNNLNNEFNLLYNKANNVMPVSPAISTIANTMIMPGGDRVVDKQSPMLGKPYSRDMSHMIPSKTPQSGTIFGVLPGTAPVNKRISNNPQIYAAGDLPDVPGLTNVNKVSTGVVAAEAAKWHSMTAAIAMQSDTEIKALKMEVAATGTITNELSASYQALLPKMTEVIQKAVKQSELIIAETKAGKMTLEQSKARIVALNAEVEALLASTASNVAAAQGRVINVGMVPLTSQPAVDPKTGKSNMKEMFHKSANASLINKIAGVLGVRTSGGGYSTQTTMPRKLNTGGYVYGMNDGDIVPGPNINADVVPAMLTPGEFVVNAEATRENLPLLRAINGPGSSGPGQNNGSDKGISNDGYMPASISNSILRSFGYRHSGSKKEANLVGRWGMILPQSINDALAGKLNGRGALGSDLINALQDPERLVDLDDFLAHNGVDPKTRSTILKNVAKEMSSKINPGAYYKDPGLGSLAFRSIDPQVKALESRYPGISLAYQKDRMTPGRRDTRKTPRPGETQAEANKRGGPSPTGINIEGQRPSNYGAGSKFADRFGPKQVYSHFTDIEYEKNTSMLAKSMGFLRRVPNPAAVVSTLMPRGRYVPRARFNKGGLVGGMPIMKFNDGGEIPPSAGRKMGAMAVNYGGSMLGYGLASKLAPGNMLAQLGGGILGDVAGNALYNQIMKIGVAAGTATNKTSLLVKAFQFFIKLPGPVKLLAGLAGVGIAIQSITKRIQENTRIVNSSFGLQTDTVAKLGLQYTTLEQRMKDYRKQTDLSNASAAAFKYTTDKIGGPQGIDMTQEELDALKKSSAKDFKTEIAMFNKAGGNEIVQKATQLKAMLVSSGMAVQNANELIYALILNSNKATNAMTILSDKGFGAIQDKASASAETLKTYYSVIQKGNTDQIGESVNAALNAYTNLENSLVNINDKTKPLVSQSEAYLKVLNKIKDTNGGNVEIGNNIYASLSNQNKELGKIINSTDTFQSIMAKTKLATSGLALDLANMGNAAAIALSMVISKQQDLMGSEFGPFAKLAKDIKNIGKTDADQIIKSSQLSADAINKQIDLHNKEIKAIKDKADARKKALDENLSDETTLLQIKKKQMEYADAIASGDMSRAAQAQLDIQSLTRTQEITVAKRSIDDKAEKDIKIQQNAIDALNAKLDGLQKVVNSAQSSATTAQKKSDDLQSMMNEIVSLITSSSDGVDSQESARRDALVSRLNKSGYKKEASMISPLTGRVGSQTFTLDKLAELGKNSFQQAYDASKKALAVYIKDPETIRLLSEGKALGKQGLLPKQTQLTVGADNNLSLGSVKASGIKQKQGTYVGQEFLDINGIAYKIIGEKYGQIQVAKKADGGYIKHYNPGGSVSGPGTGTSDSIPAYLSNGEYVIRASAVSQYGKDFFDRANAQKLADGGMVKNGLMQKWARSLTGNPLSEMMGTAALLRKIAGIGQKGDNLSAAMLPLSFSGMGIGSKIGTSGGLMKALYSVPNKINQIRNQAKVNAMIKNGMWHGSQPLGHRGEEYLQGTNILEGAESYDPFYGMGFFGTTSKSEADLYASGYNSSNNWGSSFGSMNNIVSAPKGKYIDFTRGTNSLKWQDYSLAKALGVKKNGYLGKYMPENLGDIMSGEGMTGAIMNRVNAGRVPGDIQNAKWLAWNNPAGVITKEKFAMGGIVGPKYNIPSTSTSVADMPFNRYNGGGMVNNYGGITVNPAPGMDEKMLAKYVISEMKRADAISFASQGRPGARLI